MPDKHDFLDIRCPDGFKEKLRRLAKRDQRTLAGEARYLIELGLLEESCKGKTASAVEALDEN